MSLVLDKPTEHKVVDRPAWIPYYITENWDTCPYAYQTEEELMPAGGPHGQLLFYIVEMLRHLLKDKGLMLLVDTFMLYRDDNDILRRIAPDLLLMPHSNEAPSAYNLDTEPAPLMVAEVTSPKSHTADLEVKSSFYLDLGIPTYLAIDAVKPNADLRDQIDLHLWRLAGDRMQKMDPGQDGYLVLPEMNFGVMAKGREFFFKDLETGKIARDAGHLAKTLERQQQTLDKQAKALEEERRAKEEERQAKEEERQARLKAEEENAALRAEIDRLRKEQGK